MLLWFRSLPLPSCSLLQWLGIEKDCLVTWMVVPRSFPEKSCRFLLKYRNCLLSRETLFHLKIRKRNKSSARGASQCRICMVGHARIPDQVCRARPRQRRSSHAGRAGSWSVGQRGDTSMFEEGAWNFSYGTAVELLENTLRTSSDKK